MKAIDFTRARIAWTTLHGSSGLWRMAAAARSEGGAWFLASSVMAGDVYGKGYLPLHPPYLFELAASNERHVMFREAAGPSTLDDTDALNSMSFSALAIEAPEVDVQALSLDPATLRRHWPLTARVMATGASGARWTLEFPLSHINLRDEPPAFQVETGPVVVPCDLIDIAHASAPAGIQLAYIFFNRADQADLLAFGPLTAASRRGFAHVARLTQAQIEICAA